MKKLILSLLSLVVAMTMFAQSNVRKMNLIYDGQVVYSRYVSLIDSIKFVLDENAGSGDDITGGEVDPSKQLYVGVVAFNRDVRQMAITSDMEAVKNFINEQTNTHNQTGFAYAVSKGNKMFDAAELPEFDKIFMLNFTDGFDNYSNRLWGDEGRQVGDTVYEVARADLRKRIGLNSYAMAFGDDSDYRNSVQMLIMGSGAYYKAEKSEDLQPTFNEIAKSMLASAKNVVLQTNAEYYYETNPKRFQFIFTAIGGFTDTIYASMTGTPTNGYNLQITKISNGMAYFDSPSYGEEDINTGKVNIPLNNMKFVKDGEELQFSYEVKIMKRDGSGYAPDVEDSSTSEQVAKRIAVVLVLDCSTSMGDAFEPMKAAAIEFIKTMEKMEVDDSDPNIPDPNPNTGNHEYVDLGLSVKWATCNVGASKPEEYGDYFAWGETQPKDYYDWSTYKWCNGSYNTLTKYNNSSSYGTVDNKTTLDLSDDAARANWGGSWRMPTKAEQDELREQCTWTWTTQNGVNGYKVTSKKSGYTNKSIFLPAAGCRYDSSLDDAGSYGGYWSGSLGTGYPGSAYNLDFRSDYVDWYNYYRYIGFTVRPVCQ